MEIRSGEFSPTQLHSELTYVLSLLTKLSINEVEIEYWFGKENFDVSNLERALYEGLIDHRSELRVGKFF